jgi:hypothetical protein
MTSVDDFVRLYILTYPTQFSNRTEVLHHALCVIGNGCNWDKTGTLVSATRFPMSPWNREEKLAELETEKNIRYASPITKHLALKELRREFNTCSKVVSEIDTRVHAQGRIKNFHKQSDYALLMNIPSNVTADWKEACNEMKGMATKEGWVF